MLPLILVVFAFCFVLERVRPGWRLPRVEMGVIAFMAPSIYAEITYARIAGWVARAEVINTIATLLINLFQITDGPAGRIASAIVNASDPLTWPKTICDILGEC
jgi:hypothetical protein